MQWAAKSPGWSRPFSTPANCRNGKKPIFRKPKAALQDLEKHMVLDKAQVEELTQALAEVEPALETSLQTEERATAEMTEAEAPLPGGRSSLSSIT